MKKRKGQRKTLSELRLLKLHHNYILTLKKGKQEQNALAIKPFLVYVNEHKNDDL